MHIVVVRNNANPQAIEASLLLSAYGQSQGFEIDLVDATELNVGRESDNLAFYGIDEATVDMAVALGGDGTLLHAARLMAHAQAPILGINFGHLGFLSNPGTDGVIDALAGALAGDAVAERRANLSVEVVCEGEIDPCTHELVGEMALPSGADETAQKAAGRENDSLLSIDGETTIYERPSCFMVGNDVFVPTARRTFFALNELAITRGALGRMIEFSIHISDAKLATMRGDGLVVATATGSTAYALSAGGPLVAPSFRGLIVVPIAPHSLQTRAVVTGENDIVAVEMADNAANREATLFVDGEMLVFDHPVRRIYVKRGENDTTLLRYKAKGFYDHAAETFFK